MKVATIGDLPLVRACRFWNALCFEPAEWEIIVRGTPDCLEWWKRRGQAVVLRSIVSFKVIYPHFPFEIDGTL